MNVKGLLVILVVAIAGSSALRALAQEQEKPSTGPLAKAPKAVQETVKKLVGSNKISEFGTETTLGKTLWVAEFGVKGVEYACGDRGGQECSSRRHGFGDHYRNGWRQNVLFGERQDRQCPS